MSRRATRIACALAALAVSLARPAAADSATESATAPERAESDSAVNALDRIRAAADEHPDDADLAWALVRHVARAGTAADALETAQRYFQRFPDHRPAARLEIARTLLDRGAPEQAQPLLAAEIRREPRSGTAHFYRALALRALGQATSAGHEFQAAAVLEPALRSDSLLARALILFDGAKEDEAVALLQEILRIDPTSDTAVRARLLLRDHEAARGNRRFRASALAGFEWDDNVTLEGQETEKGSSNQADFRGLWGVGASGLPWIGERGGLLIGYRYDQTDHVDLSRYDLIQNALFASLSLQPSERLRDRLAIRLDAQGYETLQHLHHALAGGSFRPNLLYAIGPRAGVLRTFASLEVAQFAGDANFEPWKRDSIAGGLGVEHTLPLPPKGSTLAVSASWLRTLTDAEPGDSNDGFDGDFDYDSLRFRALGNLALPWSLLAQVEASYSRDQYLNDNFANFIATGASKPRQDDVLAGRVSLSRPIARFTRLEAYWRGTSRASNVAVFDYDKQIVGLMLHLATE